MTDQVTPRRVMAIYAHPDDPEFFSGGTLIQWSKEGCDVTYVLITSGDKGSDDPEIIPQELIQTREAEQRAAAQHASCSTVIFLRYPDGEVEHTLELRRAITRVIRLQRPDVVVTHDPDTRWFEWGSINHPDHRAVGEAVLAAVYPSARDRFTFIELWRDEGLEPHKVKQVYLAGTRNPNIKVNITDVLKDKIAAISEHHSQVKDVEGMTKRQQENYDRDFGDVGVYTESFRVLTLR